MAVKVFAGPTGSGKSTTMIRMLRNERNKGRKVYLFLSADTTILTSRRNVRPGGLMGCRTPGLTFPINFVEKTPSTIRVLEELPPGSLAAFDEAQYFDDRIAESWMEASHRGIDVVIGMPSARQLRKLKQGGAEIEMVNSGQALKQIVEELYLNKPFPGERHAYQPIFGVDLPDWTFVRQDSLARLNNILNASQAYFSAVDRNLTETELRFLDFGCCSGFFCEGLAQQGYQATGVDVQNVFLKWGKMLSDLNMSNVRYVCKDGLTFAQELDEKFDVISALATVQWIMVQKGYDAGATTLRRLFAACEHLFILEMGYTEEDVYKGKIDKTIDRAWVMNFMREYGGFAKIVLAPRGTGGRWRDVFFGFKREIPDFDIDRPNELSVKKYDASWRLPEEAESIVRSTTIDLTRLLYKAADRWPSLRRHGRFVQKLVRSLR